jgi:signal peptidase I
MKIYRLNQLRHTLHSVYKQYLRKREKLSTAERPLIEEHLMKLESAIESGDREKGSQAAKELEDLSKTYLSKSWWQYTYELIGALIFALIIATIIRQSWFELYEIPTGSMRPTFKEQDHLSVTKTAFGINVPLETAHFIFEPDLVQRTSVVIWSGDNIPMVDSYTSYFGIFPYKKRYIKRLIAKPGDTIYFYGGKVYNVDDQGNLDQDLLSAPWMEHLEHIPFWSFEGTPMSNRQNQIIYRQMNQELGRLTFVPMSQELVGEVYNGKEWIVDNPALAKKPHDTIVTYGDFLGINNFAMSTLLSPEQVETDPEAKKSETKGALLYLELWHHPNLTYPKPQIVRIGNFTTVIIHPEKSLIPVTKEELKSLQDNLYTARFVVVDSHAKRYSVEERSQPNEEPYLPGVPDGTYEFYYGKALKIGWGGIATELPLDHPLYNKDPKFFQKLYNLGINVDTRYDAAYSKADFLPNRYAYFRDGDLYLLGAPIYKKDNPLLKKFVEQEKAKEKSSTEKQPYLPFVDKGAPLKQGKVDLKFMKTFGLKVPPKNYLVLGDNHAMSSDSRVFGFVPEANLQGAPDIILWPPGNRWGWPPQKPYPLFVTPRLIVWGIAAVVALTWYGIHRWRLRRPIDLKRK